MPKEKQANQASLDDRVTALEGRVAELERTVGDLSELHAAELGALGDRRAAADPTVQALRAAEADRDRERIMVLQRLRRGEVAVGAALGPARDMVQIGKSGRLVMASDASPLRDALSGLTKAIDNVNGLVKRDLWPEGEERLRKAEALRAKGSDVLGEFDRLLAERRAARRPAARAR